MEPNKRLIRNRHAETMRWDTSDWSLQGSSGIASGLTWEQVVRVFRKHRWLLLGVIVSVTAVAIIAAFATRDTYQPVARLEIDPVGAGIRTLPEIENTGSQADMDYLDTQVQILQSDSLAMRTIRALKLDQNPDFVSKSDVEIAAPKAEGLQKGLIAPAESSFMRDQLELADSTPDEAAALRTFHKNLTVNPIRSTRLVEVSFASHDPRLAQAATNTLVSQFIDQNYRNRYVTTMEASEWLSAQLNDLREKVTEANNAVAAYQKKYGLVESDERDVPFAELMTETSRQLSDAQADRIQAEAYARMADAGQPDSIPSVRTDIVYQNLLTRYNEARTQLAQTQSIYGEDSPNVRKLRGEVEELSTQVAAERAHLVNKVRAAFIGAQAREQMMLASRDKLRGQMGDASTHLVEYRMLKNEALAKAALYNTLETRLKEAGIYAGLHSGNIHVVDMASNLHQPTSPHRKLIVAFGAGLGLFLAFAIVLVRESLDNTVRIPDDIRDSIHLPALAVLPRVTPRILLNGNKAAQSESLGLGIAEEDAAHQSMLWVNAQSAEGEAIRSLRNNLLSDGPAAAPRVILVSSPNAGEGKSTVALNLASVLAQQGKTCLLEGDLRCPSLGPALGLHPQTGLTEVLLGTAALPEALMTVVSIPALSVLPVKSSPWNPADLMASEETRMLVLQLRKDFDYVVIDSPPVIPFSDASSLASLSDAVIIVSRYARTTRRAVSRAAELLEDGHAPLVGVVLNDIDITSADYHYFNYGYSWKMRGYYDAYSKTLPTSGPGSDDSGTAKSRGAHA